LTARNLHDIFIRMPRSPRQIAPETCYHVLNRGNDKRRIFLKQHDYVAFLEILSEGLSRYEIDLFCWCLMPNHWHLVLKPHREKSLSEMMRWVTVTHVRRYYEQYPDKTGHLYQGRFKAFAVEEDPHFLKLCRYVEANPRRAKLIEDAGKWEWSSLRQRVAEIKAPPLKPWPVDRPNGWMDLVNEPLLENEIAQIHTSVNHGRPFGTDKWVKRIAAVTGVTQSLRLPGRPPKALAELSARQRRRRLSAQKKID
jgi:putative transposase